MRNLIGRLASVALALTPVFASADPALSSGASVFGSTVTAQNQSINDGQFNVWTLVGGKAYKSGTLTPSSGVILLLYYDGIVYQENANHAWWAWLNGAWVAAADPRVPSAASSTIPRESHVVDASHTVWTLSGGKVYANGYLKPSSGVIQLLYAKGTVYQENLHHDWWVWSNGGWVETAAPVVTSASGTTVPAVAQLIDSQLKTWTLSGGKAYLSGVATPSAGVILLLYYNGSVYQENLHNNWWQWKNSAWVALAADPRVPSLAAAAGFKTLTFDSTVLGNTSGSWQVSTLNGIPGCTGAAVQNDDGSFTVRGHDLDNECYVVTAVKSATAANGWTGVTFRPGMYLKMVLSYVGFNPGIQNGGLPGGVPGFWAEAIEHAAGGKKASGALADQWPGQAANYEHWMHVDFMAAFCSVGNSPGAPGCANDANRDTDVFFTNLEDWFGAIPSVNEFESSGGTRLPKSQTWATQHTLEYVWVAASGATKGHLDGYVDGQKYEFGGDLWTPYDPSIPPPPTGDYSVYSIGDAQHMVLATGTGAAANLTVHSVQVWQAAPAGMTTQ